ncbi:hypothetical protein Zm00014a_011187 [Zea mays]|uniref:Uncharacterized protein n=1 Tax=Zea mays TaxID=4577 RepID=A0A3L6DV43_MAIZE|nr:hypothetical protein Zm00014a_011187 [Zea mays]
MRLNNRVYKELVKILSLSDRIVLQHYSERVQPRFSSR